MNANLPALRVNTRPRFGESSFLRSPLDRDALTRQWRKNKNLSAALFSLQMHSLQNASALKKARRRILGMPPNSQTFDFFYPFKIYQPTNLSSFVGQTVPMIQTLAVSGGGNFGTCLITAPNADGSSNTNLNATPPQICIADTWRFWAVRDGIVEARFTYASNAGGGTLNNFAVPLYPQYTDGLGNQANDSAGFSNPSTAAFNILVIGVNPSNGNLPGAPTSVAIWIWAEVHPDTSGGSPNSPTASLKGYALTGSDGGLDYFGQFNNGDLAIGTLSYNIPIYPSGQPAPGQITGPFQTTFNHFINRFPSGNGNFGGNGNGTAMNFRGIYTYIIANQSTAVPADLGVQYFYPGDFILVVSPEGSFDYANPWSGGYLFTGATPAGFRNAQVGPPGDVNWTQLWASPIAT
jgi:hypothetical protein